MDITTCSDLEIFLGGSTYMYAYILMRSLLTCMFLPDKGGQCLIAVRLDKNFVKDIPTRPQTGKNRHAFKRGGRPTPTS